MKIWQVRHGNRVVCWGPMETFPEPWERRRFREDGYDIYVDGKLWRK